MILDSITSCNLTHNTIAPQYEGKIIWAEMTDKSCFVWDTQGMFINQTCYFIPNANKYLLGVLNSNLVYFYMQNIASNLGDGAFRWIKQYIEKLPIPKIDSTNEAIADKIIKLVDKILESKAQDATTDTQKLESQIDLLVYELYNLNDEEIKVIEGKG